MSDYIRKSALIEEMRKGQEVIKDRLDDISVSGIYATIEAVIEEIDRQPTLDEKEIIRKPFERVVERLEEYWKSHKALEDYEMFNGTYIEMKQQEMVVKAYEKAINMVKEECGINE